MTLDVAKRSRTWLHHSSLLAMTTVLAMATLPSAAAAQAAPPADKPPLAVDTPAVAPQADADADTSKDIVVTGYRAALASAIANKRLSNNIVDVIKADDMASFPDANLAESIQRIPGVSITRDGGEGRNVTVRGLGGDFVRTLLNGIEAYSSTTGSTLGVVAGINRTRGFDYSTFASELFNSVTVNKTQSAEMDEGSLAATIDLATGHPFDKPGFRAAISGQGAYYDNNKSFAPRVAGLISDTFGDFGILVSAAYSTRKAQEDGYSDTSQSDYSDANNGFCGVAVDDPNQAGSQVVNTAIPYVNPLSGSGNRPANQCFSGLPSNAAAYAKVNQPNVFLPRNPGLGRFTLDQKRLGITGALQWQPSNDTHVTLDVVYSKFDQDRLDYALSLASNNRNVNGASAAFPLFAGRVDSQLIDVNVDPNGQVDYMKINHVDMKQIEEKSHTSTSTHEIGLTFDQNFTDRFSGRLKIGHAGSKFNQPWDVFVSYDAFNKDGYSWDARNDARRPLIVYGYDVANPANVTFTNAGTGLTPDIRIVEAQVKNNLATISYDFKYKATDTLSVKFGAMYKRFDFVAEQQQRLYPNNGTDLTKFNFAKFAADFPTLAPLSETLTNFGGQLGLPAGSATSWVVPNVQAFIDKVGVLCNCANNYGDFTISTANALGSNRKVREEDKALYAQVDFDFDVFGGHRLRGNAGVRYVATDVVATGYTSATSQVTVGHSYHDWLPAVNMALDITPDIVARAAFAMVMARPGLANLSPGGSVNTAFGAQTATIGNPLLNPYRAKNYDLSFEWYPGKGALVGVALFYKDVGSVINTLASFEPYGNTGLPLSLLPVAANPAQQQDATTPYLVTRSRNSPGGYIEGIEVNVQEPFTFLPGFLSHFGAAANYTFVKSKVLYYLATGLAPATTYNQFLNVSPHSVNATLYYDDGRFSTHVSAAYRGKYLTALPFKSGVPDANGSYATLNIDASMSFNLTKRFKITADALNLTNQPADQFSGEVRRSQRVFSTTGRQFFLGASYTF